MLTVRWRERQSEFDKLFAEYRDRVYSLVYRTVGPAEADDVTQEVFIQIHKSLAGFRGDSTLNTWIFRITINVCREAVRRRLKCREDCMDDIQETAQPSLDISEETIASWTLDKIEEAFIVLSDQERLAVEMHYVQGMSYREIAEITDCPTGTVKARIHTAMTKLRRKLLPLLEDVEI